MAMEGGFNTHRQRLRAIAICIAAVELHNLWAALIGGSMTPSQFGSHAEKADCHRNKRHRERSRCRWTKFHRFHPSGTFEAHMQQIVKSV
jgi:hypothetical protein